MKKLFERLMDRFYAWWTGDNYPVTTAAYTTAPSTEPAPSDEEPEALPPLSYMPCKEAVPPPEGPIPLHFVEHKDVPKWVTEYEKDDKPTYAYYYAPNGKGGSHKRFAFSGGHRTGGLGYRTMDDLIAAAHEPWES
jgi:hypothetical protein